MKANGRPPPHSAPIEACPLQQRHEKASPRLKTSAPHVRPLRGIGEAASLVTRAAETQVRLRRSTGKAELALPAQRRQPSKPPESSESPKLLLPLKKKKKKSRQRRKQHSLLPATPHSPSGRCSPGAPASGPATTRGPAPPPPLQVSPAPPPLHLWCPQGPAGPAASASPRSPLPLANLWFPPGPAPPAPAAPQPFLTASSSPAPRTCGLSPTPNPPLHTHTCRPPDQNPHPHHAPKAPRPGPSAPQTA